MTSLSTRSTAEPAYWARWALAAASWCLATMLLVAAVASLEVVARHVEAAPAGSPIRWIESVVLVISGTSAAVAWLAAVAHAILSRQIVGLRKWMLAVTLLVSNFVGAFLYYFFYVVWTSGESGKS